MPKSDNRSKFLRGIRRTNKADKRRADKGYWLGSWFPDTPNKRGLLNAKKFTKRQRDMGYDSYFRRVRVQQREDLLPSYSYYAFVRKKK